ncbi:hypothetical protein KC865_02375 [Candidatus Kaiserbacteria bacterium]|nr:hypothetical protein [Candidatus Kaiserbacteria bacterium]USN91799.1 MAG: hypothetical protein H6782_02915 [Candidatus Nomurabacteria bacterium]
MAQLGNIRGDLPSSPGEVKQRSGGFLLLLQPEKIGGRLTFAYWSLVYELTLLSDIKGFRHDTIISSQVNTLGESEVIGILKDYPNVVFSFLDLADWVGQEAKQAMDKAVSLLAFAQKVRDMEQRLRS